MLEDDKTRTSKSSHPNNHQGSSMNFLSKDILSYGPNTTFELIIKSKSTTGVSLRIAGGSKSSLISVRHETASDGTLKTTTHGIDDFPLFLSVDDPGLANVQGDTFVSISVRINKDISLPLVSGFVYELKPLTYPSNTMKDMIPNRGEFGTVLTADPDANDDISLTIPSNEIWRVMWIHVQLVTDATAGSRNLHLKFTEPNGAHIDVFPNAFQTASKTFDYSFAQYGGMAIGDDDTEIQVMLPDNIWLTPLSVISTLLKNDQSGDNFGPMTIMREKFYTGT